MKIYLSGWVGEVAYREYVLKEYSKLFDIKDPLTEVEKRMNIDWASYRAGAIDLSTDTINNIVDGDINVLKECDILVAMMSRYSAGTIMEIRIAYDLYMPVYIIDPFNYMKKDVWLMYHSNMFFDCTDDCFKFLKLYNDNFAYKGR